jgi:hypothetical protein
MNKTLCRALSLLQTIPYFFVLFSSLDTLLLKPTRKGNEHQLTKLGLCPVTIVKGDMLATSLVIRAPPLAGGFQIKTWLPIM